MTLGAADSAGEGLAPVAGDWSGLAGAGGPVLPWICVVSPLLCWMLSRNSVEWLGGYRFGFELLLLNGLLTAIGVATLARLPAPKTTA